MSSIQLLVTTPTLRPTNVFLVSLLLLFFCDVKERHYQLARCFDSLQHSDHFIVHFSSVARETSEEFYCREPCWQVPV